MKTGRVKRSRVKRSRVKKNKSGVFRKTKRKTKKNIRQGGGSSGGGSGGGSSGGGSSGKGSKGSLPVPTELEKSWITWLGLDWEYVRKLIIDKGKEYTSVSAWIIWYCSKKFEQHILPAITARLRGGGAPDDDWARMVRRNL